MDSEDDQPSSMEQDSPASTTSSGGSAADSGGNGGSRGGNHLFHPHKPMKLENSNTMTFTKHFYVKLYANDWIKYADTTGTSINVLGFMTVIPYQALCMYLSPNEYLDIVRNSAYARIESSNFQLEFKAVRTPFDTNKTDQAEANGNLQFEIQRWDGLEKVMPFEVVDVEGVTPPATDPQVTQPASYIELINRLYGISFASNNDNQQRFPATMRERGLSYRPKWSFDKAATNTATGPMYRQVNKYISSIPIGEYVTDCLNTNQAKMGEGYCFNKSYKPKNGLLNMASSAWNPNKKFGGFSQINMKNAMSDESHNDTTSPNDCQYTTHWVISQQPFLQGGGELGNFLTVSADAEASSVTVKTNDAGNECMQIPALDTGNQCEIELNQHGKTGAIKLREVFTTPAARTVVSATQPIVPSNAAINAYDCLGYGYQETIDYYTTANLENYTTFTSNNERPVHYMPSMMIGAIPKTNKDNTIVNATLEFEIRTNIVVKCNTVHPTYMNMARDTLGEAGARANWVDPAFQSLSNNDVYAGKWFHNEKDVALRENKFWHLNYGRAAKPQFDFLPVTVPSMQ